MCTPRGLGLSLVALLVACGGGDATAPEPPFPAVAGAYTVQGFFDGLPSSDAFFGGTLVLTQVSREGPTLSGSITLTANLGGSVFSFAEDPILGATVTPAGLITFGMADASGSWVFTGQRQIGSIGQGRHTLRSGGDDFSGAWSAALASSTAVRAMEPVTARARLGELRRALP